MYPGMPIRGYKILSGRVLTERTYCLTDFDGLAIYFDGKALFVDGSGLCNLKVLSRDVCTPPELMVAGLRSCHHAEGTAGTWLSTSKRPVCMYIYIYIHIYIHVPYI